MPGQDRELRDQKGSAPSLNPYPLYSRLPAIREVTPVAHVVTHRVMVRCAGDCIPAFTIKSKPAFAQSSPSRHRKGVRDIEYRDSIIQLRPFLDVVLDQFAE